MAKKPAKRIATKSKSSVKPKKSAKAAKKPAVKKTVRQNKASAVRGSTKSKKAKALKTQGVPAVLQNLIQVEKVILQQEKVYEKQLKGLTAKLKKADAKKEKAIAKLQAMQQKAEEKGMPAPQLKPLQKVLALAQAEHNKLSEAFTKLQGILSTCQEDKDILQAIKASALQIINNTKKSASKTTSEKMVTQDVIKATPELNEAEQEIWQTVNTEETKDEEE